MPQVDLNNKHSFLIVLETERYDIKVPAWLMGGWEHLFWFVDGCLLSVASHGKEGLLLLSCFSRVWLCATPEMAAHQAPPSLGFSRQEHWSGLPFPSPIMKVKSESEVTQSCPTLSDPMDCSPSGSSIHGIFQARVLEWGAIAFSVKLIRPFQKSVVVVNSTVITAIKRRWLTVK